MEKHTMTRTLATLMTTYLLVIGTVHNASADDNQGGGSGGGVFGWAARKLGRKRQLPPTTAQQALNNNSADGPVASSTTAQLSQTTYAQVPKSTGKKPSRLLIVADVSGSMKDPVGKSGKSKAEFLANSVNRIFGTMIANNTQGDVIEKPVYAGMIRYDDTPVSGFDDAQGVIISGTEKFVDLGTLAALAQSDTEGNGSWVKPKIGGNTNMSKAFELGLNQFENAEPILQQEGGADFIVHLSDGQFNAGANPLSHLAQLKQQSLARGRIPIFTNIWLNAGGIELYLPTLAEVMATNNPQAKLLYDMSTAIPLNPEIRERLGIDLDPTRVFMGVGNNEEALFRVFESGSSTLVN